MKSQIREYFIKNFASLVYDRDIKVEVQRDSRYLQFLDYVMSAAEENSCKCFNSAADVINALDNNLESNKSYILYGTSSRPETVKSK